jgi:hypothetical protein
MPAIVDVVVGVRRLSVLVTRVDRIHSGRGFHVSAASAILPRVFAVGIFDRPPIRTRE